MTTGGRKSEPYASSGPVEATGPPATGTAGADHEPLVITEDATCTPSPAVDAGGEQLVTESTALLVGTNDSLTAIGGIDGATGGASAGSDGCGGGAAPAPVACIAPKDCAPAPAG